MLASSFLRALVCIKPSINLLKGINRFIIPVIPTRLISYTYSDGLRSENTNSLFDKYETHCCGCLGPHELQFRRNAKGQSKVSKNKKGAGANISIESLSGLMDVDVYATKLDEVVVALKDDYLHKVAVRTDANVFDLISVKMASESHPLSTLCQIERKSAHLTIVDASAFPEAVSAVNEALHKADLGLNPRQEGNRFYVQLPKVTKEHRTELVTGAKRMLEKSRSKLRNLQNDAAKKVSLADKLPKDTAVEATKKLQEMAKERMAECEAVFTHKQKEIMNIQ